MPVDEVEPGQSQDAVAVERGLEPEVETSERLDGGEPCHLQGGLDPSLLANGDLLGEQRVDCLDRADLATLDLLDEAVQGF